MVINAKKLPWKNVSSSAMNGPKLMKFGGMEDKTKVYTSELILLGYLFSFGGNRAPKLTSVLRIFKFLFFTFYKHGHIQLLWIEILHKADSGIVSFKKNFCGFGFFKMHFSMDCSLYKKLLVIMWRLAVMFGDGSTGVYYCAC